MTKRVAATIATRAKVAAKPVLPGKIVAAVSIAVAKIEVLVRAVMIVAATTEGVRVGEVPAAEVRAGIGATMVPSRSIWIS
jgi:hypothetical protein